jgi:transposase
MNQQPLFDLPADQPTRAAATAGGAPRLRVPVRDQREFVDCTLDELLADEHPARAVWQFVAGLDLTPLLCDVAAVAGRPGRPALDPRVALALWLFATLEGVGSARELDRLCREHIAYRWLCGGVSINYHTLSDFRTGTAEFLDCLLTHSAAALLHQGLATLEQVCQDGVRVRAAAGSSSFHRRPALEEALQQAEAQVAALKQEVDDDPGAGRRRRQAARQQAADERAGRLRAALEQLPQLEAKRPAAEQGKARVSSTDPEARVMKMGDGGFRPAYNVQFATTSAGGVVVGVDVNNLGTDQGNLRPMVEQLQERYGRSPTEMLVDADFITHADLDVVSAPTVGTTVYGPARPSRSAGVDPYQPKPTDSVAVAAWRERMATAEGKGRYRVRAATAEWANAQARNRGLRQFLVRGLTKVKAIALWFGVAHNLSRMMALGEVGLGVR